MLARFKELLGHELLYVGLQKAVGADRLRYRCLDEVKPGDTVLDVGCGPAYYFERLPEVRYFGFDTSDRYIAHAQKKWGDKGSFSCQLFTQQDVDVLPKVDKVLLFGLLHHLSDEQSRELLDLSARVLAPGGAVITVDPTFEPSQGRISHWMSSNDRGEYVRTPEAFTKLAGESFTGIDGEIWNTVTRIPSSHWMMRLHAPAIA